MKDEIKFDILSNFKHIKISAACRGQSKYNGSYYRTAMFQEILRQILNKSISSLDVLEIDPPRGDIHGYSTSSNTVLGYTLNQFQYIPIRKLIWNQDAFHPNPTQFDRIVAFKSIERNLATTCPNLQHLRFGINDYRREYVFGTGYHVIEAHLGEYLIPMLSGYAQLQILDLFCPTWNIFLAVRMLSV